MIKKFNLITLIIFIFVLFYLILEIDAKSKGYKCCYTKNNYYNKVCVTYKYIEYNNKDINYNHPNALYPVKSVQLYPIYNSNFSSGNYVVKYNTVCYPYPVYYYLFDYNNYYKPLNYFNYSNYSGYSNYSSYSSYSGYSGYYYGYYDPNYLNYSPIKIEVKKVGYYDYKTGEFKESSF
ncbi:MAG: hypothetical protein ACP5RD_05230 [bacterium]